MTKMEFAEKYIAGTEGNIEEPGVQKLWIEYGFTDVLIESIDIFTDKEVIRKILASDIWKSKEYSLKEGRINNIRKLEEKEIAEHLYEVEIEFIDKNGNDKYVLKGLCDKDRIEQYKEQELYVIIVQEENEQRFSCFLIKE